MSVVPARILSISPILPYEGIQHAGGSYVWRLQVALTEDLGAEVAYVVPDSLSTSRALEDQTHPKDFSVVGSPHGRLHQLTLSVYAALKRIDPDTTYFPAALDIWTDAEIRRKISQADVLDFQWTSWARLITLRHISKGAKTVITLHDVTSQGYLRRYHAVRGWRLRSRWRARYYLARMIERHLVSVADTVIVFSDKDRVLLDRSSTRDNIAVIPPPLASGDEFVRHPPPEPVVLFLAYFVRVENQEGLQWFLNEVWPIIRQHVSGVRFRVVGARMPAHLSSFLDKIAGVEVVGFVEDLEDAYRGVTLTVVPLLSGAGVKFKTVEPIVRGLPVVSTTVGAEGIGTHDWFAGVADTPKDFAESVIAALLDPDSAFEHAKNTREKALQVFGQQAFLDSLRQIYLSPKPPD